jgi:hypothetical protein
VYARVAALLAPDLVPATVLAAVPLSELARAAADARTQRMLAENARVLADGRVRAALVSSAPGRVRGVDLADESAGSLAFAWEAALVRREPPTQALRAQLGLYQKVLALDHLLENQSRQRAFLTADGGRLIAVQNDAFTPRPVEGALVNPLARLTRHVTFSASLAEGLRRLDRARLLRALSGGGEDAMLVTPKQLEQILDRKRGLERLVDGVVARRGRKKALGLP